MKLCAVQLASRKGDLPGNLRRHLHCIERAVELGAQLVAFPELSLTGYEPSLARQLAHPADSALLDPLQALCDRHGVNVAVGLPLPAADGVHIGLPILRPHAPRLAYAKQRLHSDELPFFVAGDRPLVFPLGDRHVAPAICYESMFFEHAEQARSMGADIYLASVAKTAKGIEEGFTHYPEVARRLGMPVLLANCVGPADTFVGAGHCAAWDDRGRLLAALDGHAQGLLLLDTSLASAQALPLDDLPA
ncbi:carbon-nitrogen hydrolase family protein [Pseudomonas guariconensis]|uniref:carbon-nitrogen hydrolase family protein n=1 Tax=Pseudomonas TaxID=286 RepID=UPI001CE43160|nr:MULTISPECIES: carbon-nitrogen hydrolase family protein [Pseudomonas]MCO7637468.1 carbon-nitrogen hydrolase family protein [Pseudomonas sp. S 311-6]MCO7514017.1 carbon-nitrogen hydrolase family protein [Pseudomonas putida]MCO7564028.1 carbon-nitrogen hydrolase family protein [Pseudomonas mosselii]MCO7593898.1 carbon-nitrogen hydrolase family protein [Pseudomonas guariconensis]MCO7604919.1 carbon-nitrogen hydrolase family protein [Pseudomonas guariconensis]